MNWLCSNVERLGRSDGAIIVEDDSRDSYLVSPRSPLESYQNSHYPPVLQGVLEEWGPVLRQLLEAPSSLKALTEQGEVIVRVTGYSSDAARSFRDFLYSGTLEANSPTHLWELASMGKEYDVPNLCMQCFRWLDPGRVETWRASLVMRGCCHP